MWFEGPFAFYYNCILIFVAPCFPFAVKYDVGKTQNFIKIMKWKANWKIISKFDTTFIDKWFVKKRCVPVFWENEKLK